MGAHYESGEHVGDWLRNEHAAFCEQMDVWYGAWCATNGVARDAGELELAKDTILQWLVSEVVEPGDADGLDATDLAYVWLNAAFPPGLDADRMITALIEWTRWLTACGLFTEGQGARFAEELESTRVCFVRWAQTEAPLSTTAAGEALIRAFLWWCRQLRGRPTVGLLAGQAALTAAINLMGDVDGDLRGLAPSEWLERTAYILIEDPQEPLVRQGVDDVVQWYGVRGELDLTARRRLHRAVANAHQALIRQALRLERAIA